MGEGICGVETIKIIKSFIINLPTFLAIAEFQWIFIEEFHQTYDKRKLLKKIPVW